MMWRRTSGNSQFWTFGTGSGEEGVVYCDSTKIHYLANGWSTARTVTFFLLNANIETAYTASIVDSDDDVQGAISNDYGFKVSKSGSDVTSADLADLVSFSGSSEADKPVRHQIIHKTGTGNVTNGNTFSVAHGLGYEPMFLFYTKHATHGYFCNLLFAEFISPNFVERVRTWTDTTNIYFKNETGSTLNIAYIIFKDPLF